MSDVFKEVTAYPNFHQGHFVQWSLDPAFSDEGPYNFTVEVSEIETFEAPIASNDLGDAYCTIDDTHLKQAWATNIFYRVKLTTKNNVFYSRIAQLGVNRDVRRKLRFAAEVMRIQVANMRAGSGSKAFFFKRKNYGTVDTFNVDPVSGAAITNNSSNLGTTFKGGYYQPIPILIKFLNFDQQKELSEMGETDEKSQAVAFIIGYPKTDAADMIALADTNERYIIKKSDPVFVPGSALCVGQTLNIILVPNTDPMYELPLPTTS